MFEKEVMVRPEKKSEEEIKRELENLEKGFSAADQIVPLIFHSTNAKLLYCLTYASQVGLAIEDLKTLESLAEVDHTQETIDRLNYMKSYALLARRNGGYEATEMGMGCGNFVDLLSRLSSGWYENYRRKYEGLPTFKSEKFPGQYELTEDLERVRKNVNLHLSQRR
jgi:hypothetical protein